MENRSFIQLQQLLPRLNMPITLLDADGNSLIPDQDIRFTLPALPLPGKVVCVQGRMYQSCTAAPNWVLMATTEDMPLARDSLALCDAMISALLASNGGTNDQNSAYQRILKSDLSPVELDALAEEYQMKGKSKYYVILMHLLQAQESSAYGVLVDILPRRAEDILVDMDRHNAVLLLDASVIEEEGDIRQLVMRMQEAIQRAMSMVITIAVGQLANGLGELHRSYEEARQAMDIGKTFLPEENVFIYRTMLLERFLAELPSEMAERYHGLLFNPENNKLFGEEMLNTIDMFFRKDLNLSDTARQLYIHRNTLVYRLDKIQRQLGLDLRHFDDAVTFKLMLEMRRCSAQWKNSMIP